MSKNEETLEQLRESVDKIRKAVEELRASGINEKALLLLIQHSAGSVGYGKTFQQKIPQRTIRAVLEGIEYLPDFVFGDEDEQESE